MTNKLRVVVIATIFVIMSVAVYLMKNPQTKQVHYHAGFQIYIDGVLQDYSADKYMHLEVCSLDTHEEPSDPEERVHLHSNIGDVTHVHASGVTWGELFSNLQVPLDQSASISAYVNSQPISDIAPQPIKPYDSLVLLLGTHENGNIYLANQVSKAHMLDAEQQLESCGKQ